ncbi:hypothetical protein FRC07_014928 [Ceratobasidium sp. 392]|nr:hypothetical protein FRC07_014928 [Ceratobasidium sp. 392]
MSENQNQPVTPRPKRAAAAKRPIVDGVPSPARKQPRVLGERTNSQDIEMQDEDYVNSDNETVMLSPPKAVAKPKASKATPKSAISKPKKSKTADSEHMQSTGGNGPNEDPKEFELIPFSGWTKDWMDSIHKKVYELKKK